MNDVQDVLDALAELITEHQELDGDVLTVESNILIDFLDNQNAIYAPACGECAA